MTTEERFFRKIRRDHNGCWNWIGYKDKRGYGHFGFKYGKCKPGAAHRFSYINFIGEIPDGLVIDHLCDNPSCVNPFHLYPTTSRLNTFRGKNAPASINHHKTHCKYGHEFTPENTMIIHNKKWRANPGRRCKVCASNAQRRHRAKKVRLKHTAE